MCRVNSRVRFALTGTPVENRLGELWSIFSFFDARVSAPLQDLLRPV